LQLTPPASRLKEKIRQPEPFRQKAGYGIKQVGYRELLHEEFIKQVDLPLILAVSGKNSARRISYRHPLFQSRPLAAYALKFLGIGCVFVHPVEKSAPQIKSPNRILWGLIIEIGNQCPDVRFKRLGLALPGPASLTKVKIQVHPAGYDLASAAL